MTLSALKVIPAGAGSGKTYTLEKTLGHWVAEGKVAPDRIVAVTFTEAAAGELSARLRQELVRAGSFEAALRLDQAYISTLHGFGLRLLKEFAFEAGLSPRPRLLSEGEEDAFVRLAVARTDKADAVLQDLDGHGYRWDFISGNGAEDKFRTAILGVTKLLRDLDRTQADPALVDDACAWVSAIYGVTGDGDGLTAGLHRMVTTLLKAFPDCLSEIATNATAQKAFREDHRALLRAAERGTLARDWELWQRLRSLRQSKRGSPTPENYDDLAQAVMDAADLLPTHPGPRDHALTHLRCLMESGQDVLVRHAQAKVEAGLLDFSDMLSLSYRLLATKPDVLATLRRRIDCMVIDEFQDTNPLQFSLLWLLKAADVPTVVVGDLKQAIMGFQGADPRLFQALQTQNAAVCQPLDSNWRSQPALMTIINRIGAGLFPDYVDLKAQGTRAPLSPLEVLHFREKPGRNSEISLKDLQPAHVAAYLRDLLDDPTSTVIDRRSKQQRPLRGSDIAVLCPTHAMLGAHAAALRAAGVRARLAEPGWLNSRPVQIVLHALDYVADANDLHAALFLAVTELGQAELAEGMTALCDGQRPADPLLDRLDGLRTGPADRTVGTLMAETVEALDLLTAVEAWPDGGQSRADLVRLLAEAETFDGTEDAALAGAALYGRDVRVFRAWLETRAELDDRRPAARVRDDDAVQLVTWHACKGREWPVTVVAGLERKVNPRLPNLAAAYDTFDDLSAILPAAQMRWSPSFAAPESTDRFKDLLLDGEEEGARRLLYVALTRARDRLVLCWPAYLARDEDVTYWSILTDKARMHLTVEGMSIGGKETKCRTRSIGAVPPDQSTVQGGPPLQRPYGRRAVIPAPLPASLTPDSITASGHGEGSEASHLGHIDTYGQPLKLATRLPADVRGTLVHRCFEVLPVLDDPARLSAALQPPLSAADLDAITVQVRAFEAWLAQRFPGAVLHREAPLIALDKNGSVINGTIDLIVETSDGLWIIDHKTETVTDANTAFAHHWPQLSTYAQALAAARPDLPVKGVAVHWPLQGQVGWQSTEKETA